MRLLWRRRPPLDCQAVADRLDAFLDSELDDRTTRAVEEHLEMCRICGLEAETYHLIKDALAGCRPTLDDDAIERLRAFGRELGPDQP